MNNNLVKILKVKKGFFKNKILIEALGNCEAKYLVPSGNWIIYYIAKNHKQWIKISKKFIFYKNDIVNFSSVCNLQTYKQFLTYKKFYSYIVCNNFTTL